MNRNRKNINSPLFGFEKGTFPMLFRIPEIELQDLINQYTVYTHKETKMVRMTFFVVVIVVCFHNFFVVSDMYNATLQHMMIGIMVLFLIPAFAFIIILIRGRLRVVNTVKKVCLKNNLDRGKTRKELKTFLVGNYGGYGV